MKIASISAFNDNYIWALTAHGHCVVVDPGQASPVQHYLAQHGLRLSGILVTHHHHDHVEGIADLVAQTPVPVFGPDNSAIPHLTHRVSEGDKIALPGLNATLTVLEVPGHTADHVAYYGQQALFCGDTLFAAGCGRVLGGSIEQLFASLQRLAQLPPSTHVYCAHEYTLSNLRFAQQAEPDNAVLIARQQRCAQLRAENQPTLPSLLSEELATNPFLRTSQATIHASAEQFCAQPLATELAVFTQLRAWKNVF